MENALLVGLSRQIALARELDVIANNVANSGTNGFKARSSRFEEYTMPAAKAETFRKADQNLSFVIDAGTPLDTSQGPIQTTGNPLDAAIKGDAFFAVQTPAGERYTRNGSFSLDSQGQLVTADGYPVLTDNGPVTIPQQETGLAIGPDGVLSTTQGQRGKLRLVTFADNRALRNQGANLFSSTTPAQPAGPGPQLEPGALEHSNVRPVVEMTRLIEVNRAYASVAGLIGRMDEMKRTALSRLSDANAS
jgi:flagellar basal-body rod protein FlgF